MANRRCSEPSSDGLVVPGGAPAAIVVPGLRVDLRADGDRTVISPCGDLCVDTVPAVTATVDRLLDAGRRHLVVDLQGVDLLGAAGLTFLVEARQRCEGQGGSLTWVDPSLPAARVLLLCSIDSVEQQAGSPTDPIVHHHSR